VEAFLGKVYHSPPTTWPEDRLGRGARYGELNYRISRAWPTPPQRPMWYRGDYFGDRFAPRGPARAR
jgi:hypothetical protein